MAVRAVEGIAEVLATRTEEMEERGANVSLSEALGWLGGLVADMADVLAERLDEIAKRLGVDDS